MPVLRRLCLALLPAASLASSSGNDPLASTREACRALVEAASEKQDAEIALMCRSRMDQKECSTVIDSLGGRPWSSAARESTCERHEDLLARRFLLQQKAASPLDNSTHNKAHQTVPVSTTTRRISYENEFKTPPATLNQLGNDLPTSNAAINAVDKVIMRNTPAEGGTILATHAPSTTEEITTPKPVITTEEITTPEPVTTAEETTTPKPVTTEAPTTPEPTTTTEEITTPTPTTEEWTTEEPTTEEPTTEEPTTEEPTTEEPTTTSTTEVDLESIPDNLETAPAPLGAQTSPTAEPVSPPSGASVEAINSAVNAQATSSATSASSGSGWDDFMGGPSPPPAQASTGSSQSSGSDEVTGDSSAAASSSSSSSSSAEAETPAAESPPAASTEEKSSSAEAVSATGTSSDAKSSAGESSSDSEAVSATGTSSDATSSDSGSSDSEAGASFASFVSGQEKFQRQEGLRQKESARQNAKSRLTSAVVVVSLVAGISAFALRSRWVEGPRIMDSSGSSRYSRIDQLAPTSESRELQLTSALRMDDIESAVE